jgi:hypothetical protein
MWDGSGRRDDQAPPSPEMPKWARQGNAGRELGDERMAAYFGKKWEPTYKRKLAPFLDDPSFVPTWNWSAALSSFIGPVWFLYRKLYLPFALFFLAPATLLRFLTGPEAPQVPSDIMKPENRWFMLMTLAVQVSTMLAAGGTANWFLFRRARAATKFVTMQEVPESDALALLRRMGGVNRIATLLFVVFSLTMVLAGLRA